MELLTLISSFLLALSVILPHCASDQPNLQKPLQQVDHAKITQHSLPRKLINLHEDQTVKTSAVQDFMPTKKLLQGTKQHEKEENAMNAAEKGTAEEEEEEEKRPNKSEYFTMDYGWVRRRRPIHNKQIPFVP